MAACLLLAYKFNEPNVQLVEEIQEDEGGGKKRRRKSILSTFRVNRKNETTFASVMEVGSGEERSDEALPLLYFRTFTSAQLLLCNSLRLSLSLSPPLPRR